MAVAGPLRMVSERILVPIDFCDVSETLLLRHAVQMSEGEAEIVLLHVLGDPYVLIADAPVHVPGDSSRTVGEFMQKMSKYKLDELRKTIAQPGITTSSVVRTGVAARVICEEATAMQAALIVMGKHRRTGVERLLLGSVAERVVRSAPCPVLTVSGPVRAATSQ